ncbi:MAG TPA: hypothetical protein VIO43_06845 [Lutibacter sp.]
MNINHLKSKSLLVETAYLWFFVFQAPYSYLGKWGLQLLYWLNIIYFFIILSTLFSGEKDVDPSLVIPLILFSIWPINQFFAIPYKIKKYNLTIYEKMLKTDSKK